MDYHFFFGLATGLFFCGVLGLLTYAYGDDVIEYFCTKKPKKRSEKELREYIETNICPLIGNPDISLHDIIVENVHPSQLNTTFRHKQEYRVCECNECAKFEDPDNKYDEHVANRCKIVENQTLLHIVVMDGDSDTVDYLVENGCNMHALNSLNETPLQSVLRVVPTYCFASGTLYEHFMISYKKNTHFESIIETLIMAGSDWERKDDYGTVFDEVFVENTLMYKVFKRSLIYRVRKRTLDGLIDKFNQSDDICNNVLEFIGK